MPTISEGHLARSLERSRARCPGKAARKGPRTAWGQYESEGAFPAFSSTHPKKTPGSELIQPGGRSNICKFKRWQMARPLITASDNRSCNHHGL